jgi:hypothetical protein
MSEPLFRDADLVQSEIDAERVRAIYKKYRRKIRFVDEIRNSSYSITKSDAETLYLFLRHGVSDDFLGKLPANQIVKIIMTINVPVGTPHTTIPLAPVGISSDYPIINNFSGDVNV